MIRVHASVHVRTAFVALTLALAVGPAEAQTLRGSTASLDLQNEVAREHDFTYLESADEVMRFVVLDLLVRVREDASVELHDVSFPYARPEVALFVERLARQYRSACGERLVVTSLTRPLDAQPANASDRSVHPTGMAVDLRRSTNSRCRSWLERVLSQLEAAGLLDATRERSPPHYHIVVFPSQYAGYVERLAANTGSAAVADEEGLSHEATQYTVRRGDSLWDIARAVGTTVDQIKTANGLNGSRIYAGQVIVLPAG